MAVSEGGGGGMSTMCEISPSDQIGIINNLMDRIAALERIVSQLSAVNVSANQLSDISQQIGWVHNVTYMGQPGWTQTEYGTLIPPQGWSLSSLGLLDYAGNPYQNAVLDSDGVLQWGVDSDAVVSGTQSLRNQALALIKTDTIQGTPSSSFVFSPDLIIASDPFGLVTLVASDAFRVVQSGWYHLSLSVAHSGTSETTASGGLYWQINSNTSETNNAHDATANDGPAIHFQVNEGESGIAYNSSRILYIGNTRNNVLVAQNTQTDVLIGRAAMYIRLLEAG